MGMSTKEVCEKILEQDGRCCGIDCPDCPEVSICAINRKEPDPSIMRARAEARLLEAPCAGVPNGYNVGEARGV